MYHYAPALKEYKMVFGYQMWNKWANTEILNTKGIPTSSGLILSQKIEFWKIFTFHAPLEIQDAYDLWVWK